MKNALLILCMPFLLLAQTKNAEYYWEISEQHNQKGNRDSAIIVLQDAISIFQNIKQTFELSSSYNHLGLRYQTYGEWGESSFAYTKSLSLLKDTENFQDLKAEVFLNLGLLYVKVKDSSAAYYLDIAEEIALKEDYHSVLFVLYKVTNRLNKGIEFSKRIANNQYLSNYYYLLANQHDDLSHTYFDSARVVMPELPKAKLQNFQYHAFIVGYFLRTNQLDSALYHCKEAEKVAPLLNDNEVEYHYMSCYSETYKKMGDYKLALEYRNKSDSLESLYKSPMNLAILDKKDNQMIFFKKENEILQLESEKKLRTIMILSFLMLFIVIYFFLKKENRINLQLKNSNKTKDRLFSIISHDLRGSVVSINLLSQSEGADNLRLIKKGSDVLLLEFDNLLNWSAEHLDKIILHPKNLDLNEIIEETIDLLKTQILDKNINIIKEYKEDCIAFADENTIRIVIRNILHNAIKYSPEKSEIRISIEENETITKIEIKDNGCGFEFNHQSKGLGIGIDLCIEFMKLNEGELIIDSDEKGSKVSIVLANKV